MYRRDRFGRFPSGWPGFTRPFGMEVQDFLGVLLPLVVPEIHVLLTAPFVRAFDPRSRLGLSVSPPFGFRSASLAEGPASGRGKAGRNLSWLRHFLHPETERQATEVDRYGSGVWFERRSLAWSQVPCAEQWLTVG